MADLAPIEFLIFQHWLNNQYQFQHFYHHSGDSTSLHTETYDLWDKKAWNKNQQTVFLLVLIMVHWSIDPWLEIVLKQSFSCILIKVDFSYLELYHIDYMEHMHKDEGTKLTFSLGFDHLE